jgi:CheY-like chemotaxis protein
VVLPVSARRGHLVFKCDALVVRTALVVGAGGRENTFANRTLPCRRVCRAAMGNRGAQVRAAAREVERSEPAEAVSDRGDALFADSRNGDEVIERSARTLAQPHRLGDEIAITRIPRALRADLAEPAIIILLTADLHPERDLAEAVGIDMVLTKPVQAALVTGMIDLVRTRRRRELEVLR